MAELTQQLASMTAERDKIEEERDTIAKQLAFAAERADKAEAGLARLRAPRSGEWVLPPFDSPDKLRKVVAECLAGINLLIVRGVKGHSFVPWVHELRGIAKRLEAVRADEPPRTGCH